MLEKLASRLTCSEADVIRAAVDLGRLVARGLLTQAECAGPLLAAGARIAPPTDAAGLRMRLANALADAADAETRARVLAWRRLRHALAPALAARLGRAALLRVATDAGGAVFSPAELLALTEAEVARAMRRGLLDH